VLGFSALSAAPLADTGKSIKNASASITAVSTTSNVTPATEWYYLGTGYGRSTFGSGQFGRTRVDNPIEASASVSVLSTVIKPGSASISADSSTSASARRVVEGSVMIYGTSQTDVNTTANGSRVREASALASVASTVSSPSADRIVDGTASVSASATTSSSAVTVVDAASAIPGTATTVSSGQRVRESSAAPSATASTSANGVFTVSASGSISASSTIAISYVRILKSSGLISSTASTAGIGREKWEPISKDAQAWIDTSTDSQSWTGLPEDSQEWSAVGADAQSWSTIPVTSNTWSNAA